MKTYEELAEEWLKIHKLTIKQSTYYLYATLLKKHLIPDLGKYNIKDLDHRIIQTYILENKTLSPNTIRDIIVIFKLTIKFALKMGYIDSFDLTFSLPKANNKSVEILTKQEYNKLINYLYLYPTDKNIGLLLALLCGLRIGEVCALRWKDIDFSQETVTISNTGQRIFDPFKSETFISITTPKTKSSKREIPISSSLTVLIKNLKLNNEDFIISSSMKFLEPRSYRNHLKKTLSHLDIKQIKFHSLRHTFATRCIELGGDYKVVSEILGHSNVTTTMNLYVHPNLAHKRKIIALLNQELTQL